MNINYSQHPSNLDAFLENPPSWQHKLFCRTQQIAAATSLEDVSAVLHLVIMYRNMSLITHTQSTFYTKTFTALYGLSCADVPLRNYSLVLWVWAHLHGPVHLYTHTLQRCMQQMLCTPENAMTLCCNLINSIQNRHRGKSSQLFIQCMS